MPSSRRVRLFTITVIVIVVTILFFTSQKRQSSPQDPRTINSFFGKTVNGLDNRHGGGKGQVVMSGKGSSTDANLKDHDGDGSVDEDDEILAQEMAERLRAAEQQAKDQANAKAPLKPDPPSNVVGVGSSAGGQTKGKSRISKENAEDVEEDDEKEVKKKKNKDEEVNEDSEVEVTFNQIMKKSPGMHQNKYTHLVPSFNYCLVIIFSKSYCPYSKRAKGVLLEKYTIEPKPYVVELDEHPLGQELQALLGEKTGRRTVPNILVNGKSIGGSDEIAGLDTRKTLIDKFKSMGGMKLSMKERFIGNAKE
jgi:glutaredoxin